MNLKDCFATSLTNGLIVPNIILYLSANLLIFIEAIPTLMNTYLACLCEMLLIFIK